MSLRHFTALLTAEYHGRSLQDLCKGKAAAEFPLGGVYDRPLSWREGVVDQQLAGKTLAQLLEMQARAPGVVVRYIFGVRFSGLVDADRASRDRHPNAGRLDGRSSEGPSAVQDAGSDVSSAKCDPPGADGREKHPRLTFAMCGSAQGPVQLRWVQHPSSEGGGLAVFAPRTDHQFKGPRTSFSLLRVAPRIGASEVDVRGYVLAFGVGVVASVATPHQLGTMRVLTLTLRDLGGERISPRRQRDQSRPINIVMQYRANPEIGLVAAQTAVLPSGE